ncbi:MAG: hypothetical protein N2423_08665, partial [Novosphingobium sp.]|nr:hypothetical protein [Novosphingobium sp.]
GSSLMCSTRMQMMKQTDKDGRKMVSQPASDGGQPSHPVSAFVQKHPGIAIAGGVAIGILAAALIPRRNRALVTRKSSALAETLGMTGLMLLRAALERAGAMARRVASPASTDSDRSFARAADWLELRDIFLSLLRFLRQRSQR